MPETIDFRKIKFPPVKHGKMGLIYEPPNPKNFQFRDYLPEFKLTGNLPTPKPGPLNRIPAGLEQGVMLNNSLGCCVCSCCGHMVLDWSAIANGINNALRPTDDQIEDVYCRACGYIRGNSATDQGCSLDGVLSFMRQYGVAVGNDPVLYTGQMLAGPQFQLGESLVCKTVDPLRLNLVAYNKSGQVIPPSVMPIWALNSTNEQQVVSSDGLTDTITGPNGSTGQLNVSVGNVRIGPLLISIAKDTGIFQGTAGNNLLVSSEIHPFQPDDVIVGTSSGAQFQVAHNNVSVFPTIHKIFGYVESQSQGPFKSIPPDATSCMDEIKLEIDMLGGTMIGVQLMTYIQGQSFWDVTSGATTIWGNHCVWCVDYDAEGIWFVSWGRWMKMTWAFFLKYVFQVKGAISRDWITPGTGMAPSGFDLQQLRDKINALATAP